MNPAHEDEKLSGLLRTELAPLPDDGFSAQVLEGLPPARKSPKSVLPVFAIALGALAGLAFALTKVLSSDADFPQLQRELIVVAVQLSDPVFVLALGLTGLSLLIAYAMSSRFRFRFRF